MIRLHADQRQPNLPTRMPLQPKAGFRGITVIKTHNPGTEATKRIASLRRTQVKSNRVPITRAQG
jgi:hypothetical protein